MSLNYTPPAIRVDLTTTKTLREFAGQIFRLSQFYSPESELWLSGLTSVTVSKTRDGEVITVTRIAERTPLNTLITVVKSLSRVYGAQAILTLNGTIIPYILIVGQLGGTVDPGVNLPVFTVQAALTGTLTTGSTLTCDGGTVTGSGVVKTYQWQADGVNIPGATSSTYVVDTLYQFAVISCVVTATNGAGSAISTATAAAPIAINFGVKTRSGHGGFPIGAASGAAITGTNSTDFVIDERGHIAPSGTYGAYKTYAGSTYNLTVAGVVKPVPIRTVAAQAHVREMTGTADGGTATVNIDTTSSHQLRTVLFVDLGQNGALVGNDIVKCRDGDFNPLNTLQNGGLQRPTNGWSVSGGQRIYVESENPDLSTDSNGNRRRGGGFRTGRFWFLSGVTTDWTPVTLRYISFYTNNASIATSQSFVAFQSTTGVMSPQFVECRFELGAAVTGSARNTFTNINARKNTDVTRCHIKGGGNGILGGSDGDNITIKFTVFEETQADPINLNGGGHVIEDNFGFNYRPPSGAHPDFIQIIDGAGDKAQSFIRRNISVRNVGVVNEDDGTGIFGGPSSPRKALDWVVENNIFISSQINNIRLGGMDNISNRGNTSLFDINTTDDIAIGNRHGDNRLEPSWPGTGGTINYNVANAFDWAAQTGATFGPNKTLTPVDYATYQVAFPNFPSTVGDFCHNRAQAIFIATPANTLSSLGGVMETDGRASGALFPDGSWNDFVPYVNGRLPPAT